MDKIFTRGEIVVTEPPVQSLREKLMLAASAGILACVAPSGFYGIRAQAQAVPVECDDPLTSDEDNNADGNANDGETIECVSDPSFTAIDAISTTATDLTLVIGQANDLIGSTRVLPSSAVPAITMNGAGTQNLEIDSSGYPL